MEKFSFGAGFSGDMFTKILLWDIAFTFIGEAKKLVSIKNKNVNKNLENFFGII
jgi:hypothetical protein